MFCTTSGFPIPTPDSRNKADVYDLLLGLVTLASWHHLSALSC